MTKPNDINTDYWATVETLKKRTKRRNAIQISPIKEQMAEPPLRRQKLETLLIIDDHDKSTSFYDMFHTRYLVTVPNCTHNVDYNFKLSEDDAKQRGLDYYTFERAMQELPRISEKQFKLGCTLCVDQKWQSLKLRNDYQLYILDFEDDLKSILLTNDNLRLYKPAEWYDIQGSAVIINGLSSEFLSMKDDIVKFIYTLAVETKIGFFKQATIEMKYQQLAKKMKPQLSDGYNVYSPPIIDPPMQVSADVDVDDDLFCSDLTGCNESLSDESESSQSECCGVVEEIKSNDDRDIPPSIPGIRIRGGVDAYLFKQFLPNLYSTYIQDRTLYYLCQESLEYWVPILNKAEHGSQWTVGTILDGYEKLQAGAIFRMLDKGYKSTGEIVDHLAYTMMEKAHAMSGEFEITVEDSHVVILKI